MTPSSCLFWSMMTPRTGLEARAFGWTLQLADRRVLLRLFAPSCQRQVGLRIPVVGVQIPDSLHLHHSCLCLNVVMSSEYLIKKLLYELISTTERDMRQQLTEGDDKQKGKGYETSLPHRDNSIISCVSAYQRIGPRLGRPAGQWLEDDRPSPEGKWLFFRPT